MSAIARGADLSMSNIDYGALEAPSGVGGVDAKSRPLNEEATEELDNLMSDIDDLPDGTGR